MTQHQPPTPTPVLTSSRQVSWWSVHEYVVARLRVEHWPMLGSPPWCSLEDGHPAKVAAILDGARHWALRVEWAQQARADAASEISAAADWPAIAQYAQSEAAFYAERPWLRRSVVA